MAALPVVVDKPATTGYEGRPRISRRCQPGGALSTCVRRIHQDTRTVRSPATRLSQPLRIPVHLQSFGGVNLLRFARRLKRSRRRRRAARLAAGSGLFTFAAITVALSIFGPGFFIFPISIPIAMIAAALATISVAFVITIPLAFILW